MFLYSCFLKKNSDPPSVRIFLYFGIVCKNFSVSSTLTPVPFAIPPYDSLNNFIYKKIYLLNKSIATITAIFWLIPFLFFFKKNILSIYNIWECPSSVKIGLNSVRCLGIFKICLFSCLSYHSFTSFRFIFTFLERKY